MNRNFLNRMRETLGRRFRARRMVWFFETFRPGTETSVIDVGGTQSFWQGVSTLPRVTVVNLEDPETADDSAEVLFVQGDGRSLRNVEDKSYDIAFSNSVIEHLASSEDQLRFAEEIRRVGVSYYVQTPALWFPIEPHFLAFGVHWLPPSWRGFYLRWASVWGWVYRPITRGGP